MSHPTPTELADALTRRGNDYLDAAASTSSRGDYGEERRKLRLLAQDCFDQADRHRARAAEQGEAKS